MKVIWIIAKNTYREIIRDRILYGLVLFALLLLGLSLALGQLSFTEQARISANFGFSGIQMGAVILAIFVGGTLVAREIEKQTILTLLVRPMTRLQFLMGKCLGLLFVIITVISGLAMVQALVFMGLGVELDLMFLVGLLGVFLEAMVLLGFAIFFSTFTRPLLVAAFSIGLFLIGHWLDNLSFLSNRSDSLSFIIMSKFAAYSLPNLERFNWRSLMLYDESIGTSEIMVTTLYGLSWWCVLVILSSMIIRKKDFV